MIDSSSIALRGIPNLKQEPTNLANFNDTSTLGLPEIGYEHEEV